MCRISSSTSESPESLPAGDLGTGVGAAVEASAPVSTPLLGPRVPFAVRLRGDFDPILGVGEVDTSAAGKAGAVLNGCGLRPMVSTPSEVSVGEIVLLKEGESVGSMVTGWSARLVV